MKHTVTHREGKRPTKSREEKEAGRDMSENNECAELELSLSTSEFMQTFSQQNTTAVYLPEQVRLQSHQPRD